MHVLSDPYLLIYNQWVLLRRLTRREFEARFRGSFLGLAWALITPVAMMTMYTFVFHGLLASRWPGQTGASHYALHLLAGLTVFNVVAEVIGRSPRLVLENPSYVKKLLFPVEILPLVALMGAITSAIISGVVLLLFHVALLGAPPATVCAIPLLALPLLFMCLGASYILAGLGVFLRDIAQITGPLVMALMFLSPVFYSSQIVPQPWRGWLELSPVAATIGWVRGALFQAELPAASVYLAHLCAGALVLALGHKIFMKLRPGFCDVM